MPMLENVLTEYHALTEAVGVARLVGETLIEMRGEDRATFLNNLCTNEVRRLEPGQGCELFLTDVRGKTIGHAVAYCGAESLVLATAPAQADALLAHLDRYVIREDVQLFDRSAEWSQLLLVGPTAGHILTSCLEISPPGAHLEHVDCEVHDHRVNVSRTDFYGPMGFILRSDLAGCDALAAVLADASVVCGAEAVNAIRIEAGTPRYGDDIRDDNLPQEIDRDNRAISFTKGCYLGQETVARIDALGHVNRKLCGVRFAADVILAVGAVLTSGDEIIGRITSVTFSPRLGSPLALAYLKRGYDEPGTQLDSEAGPVEVVQLPIV